MTLIKLVVPVSSRFEGKHTHKFSRMYVLEFIEGTAMAHKLKI